MKSIRNILKEQYECKTTLCRPRHTWVYSSVKMYLKDTVVCVYSGGAEHSLVLVEREADVRVRNDNGQTASDVARNEGKEDVAQWLDLVSRG